ncbi:SPFH domain-containing protein [Pelomonas sp. SE-A7]|uniref:SPFH domain-containing protein n=1 Tax=Pelomonas sp. SE-A7 TaxID=3054953 RepID=UPI00259D0414|nr:SPFH domain-containing protein [Pelomonas sp. SE-A7]MDM4768511.1 SPFH domain-containing protein [Pelomonas sp. SE-A7]
MDTTNLRTQLSQLPAAIRSALPPVNGRLLATLLTAGVVGGLAYGLVSHPPFYTVQRGEAAVRTNLFSGETSIWREGRVLMLPGVHEVRGLPLQDQSYRAVSMSRADGTAPLQSVEGLSLGLDLSVRYAIDPARLALLSRSLPDNIERDLVEPALQGVAYRLIARHTVREVFSSKRAEIQQQLEAELRVRLAADGLLLRGVQIGKVDLPADYRKGMDALLAEGLSTEKMRYTLELKDKQVKQSELEGAADKVRRELAAEAAAREQVIAAKAQDEAMKYVIPLKQRQIEQRQLEAEAANVARVKMAEGSAQARRIEAEAEAQARQKLADAEAYRLAQLGKVNAQQMAAEGELITRHPLLVQKTLADKLSDKVQVIIAPPPAAGGFIGNGLLGANKTEAKE